MSGFATSWLDLREPADHAARDRTLLAKACAGLSENSTVADLGAGTGSTLRALSPHLAVPVRWRLVDNDPALLATARERMGEGNIVCVEADLAAIDALPIDGADLVTASALFDLVSRDWLERFVTRLSACGAALYAALNYDGATRFAAAHPDDEHMVAAFNVHQRGDKGLGPALGPDSPIVLVTLLEAAGYEVESADSPWKLEPGPLLAEFLEGYASAVRETGALPSERVADWLAFRLAAPGAVIVGHRDVFARRL